LEERLRLLLNSPALDRLLLVHNLYLKANNIKEIKGQFGNKMNLLYWVLCPNSNLYIENKLPPVMDMVHHQLQICLGTDSLASNQKLSVLDEMITLQHHFPELTFQELIRWATLNGAKALGMDAELGSFEKGKKPGVLLLTGFDFKNHRLNPSAEVTRLV
jgi:cytosine/adenosine deaminase-related metal-dependent hydrolase